jgi:prepilin-type processing-associated H-X9-DG protein
MALLPGAHARTGAAGGLRDDDGSPLPATYRRTREGIARFFITDINNPSASAQADSSLFIMWDAWAMQSSTLSSGMGATSAVGYFNHVPGGSNVLYMDGHVEFIRYGSAGPIKSPQNTSALDSEAARHSMLLGGFG